MIGYVSKWWQPIHFPILVTFSMKNINSLLHKTPEMQKCAYLLSACDSINAPRLIHHPWSQNFVTNRCGATPNTFPDSLLDGESGEVFEFALHLFVTTFLWSWVINQPWRILAYMRSEGGRIFAYMCSEGRRICRYMQQGVNCDPHTGSMAWTSLRRMVQTQMIDSYAVSHNTPDPWRPHQATSLPLTCPLLTC